MPNYQSNASLCETGWTDTNKYGDMNKKRETGIGQSLEIKYCEYKLHNLVKLTSTNTMLIFTQHKVGFAI